MYHIVPASRLKPHVRPDHDRRERRPGERIHDDTGESREPQAAPPRGEETGAIESTNHVSRRSEPTNQTDLVDVPLW